MQHVLELRPPRPKVRALVELALYADFIDFNDALIAVDDADDLTKTLSVLIDIVHRQGRVPRTIEFILGALMHRRVHSHAVREGEA